MLQAQKSSLVQVCTIRIFLCKGNLSLWINPSKKLSTNRADGWLLDCFLPVQSCQYAPIWLILQQVARRCLLGEMILHSEVSYILKNSSFLVFCKCTPQSSAASYNQNHAGFTLLDDLGLNNNTPSPWSADTFFLTLFLTKGIKTVKCLLQ